MKIISVVVAAAFLIVGGVLISLVRSGGALKPAGVIKPWEINADPEMIGKQVAQRLFPDFHAAKHVIWRIENGAAGLADIPRVTLAHYRGPVTPALRDLRGGGQDNCVENCWYILDLDAALPDSLAQKMKVAPTAEVFISYFNRSEEVPEACDKQKLLSVECMRPVSVREVRRKIKTPAPHFFMQRYQQAQFYLFVEKQN